LRYASWRLHPIPQPYWGIFHGPLLKVAGVASKAYGPENSDEGSRDAPV